MNSLSAISITRPPTSLLLRCDGVADLRQRDVVGPQLVGIDGDLVLLHEAADARHLGDARARR